MQNLEMRRRKLELSHHLSVTTTYTEILCNLPCAPPCTHSENNLCLIQDDDRNLVFHGQEEEEQFSHFRRRRVKGGQILLSSSSSLLGAPDCSAEAAKLEPFILGASGAVQEGGALVVVFPHRPRDGGLFRKLKRPGIMLDSLIYWKRPLSKTSLALEP